MTMTLISTVTVGSGGTASVGFSSIPSIYTDLLLVMSARTSASAYLSNGLMTINSDYPTSIYTRKLLYGTGTAKGSSGGTDVAIGIDINGANTTSNTFSSCSIYIPNYRSSTNKSLSIENIVENNSTADNQNSLQMFAGLWASTAPITAIDIYTGNMVQGTTASLYGILKGSGGATVS